MRHRAARWRRTLRAPQSEEAISGLLALGVLLAAAALPSGCVRCHSPLQKVQPQPVAQKSGVHNPEDIELIDRGNLLLVSNGVGRDSAGGGAITAFTPAFDDLKPTPLGWPDEDAENFDLKDPVVGDADCRDELPPECQPLLATQFSPHGIASVQLADGRVRVAAVNHRPVNATRPECASAFDGRDGVEFFDLRNDGAPHLVWRGCVRMPDGTRGNDLAFAPDGKTIVVANCAPHGVWSWLAGLLWQSGNLQQWTPGCGWRTVPGSSSNNPNGVAVTTEAIYFSASTSGRVWRLPVDGAQTDAEKQSVCVGGYPDNLTLTSRSTLLVATHTSLCRFLKCAKSGCKSPWAVYEIKLDLSEYRPIVANDGSDVSLVSSVVLLPANPNGIADRFVFGSVAGDRLGTLLTPTAAWEHTPCRK